MCGAFYSRTNDRIVPFDPQRRYSRRIVMYQSIDTVSCGDPFDKRESRIISLCDIR